MWISRKKVEEVERHVAHLEERLCDLECRDMGLVDRVKRIMQPRAGGGRSAAYVMGEVAAHITHAVEELQERMDGVEDCIDILDDDMRGLRGRLQIKKAKK